MLSDNNAPNHALAWRYITSDHSVAAVYAGHRQFPQQAVGKHRHREAPLLGLPE
jgi:hypothetical protein